MRSLLSFRPRSSIPAGSGRAAFPAGALEAQFSSLSLTQRVSTARLFPRLLSEAARVSAAARSAAGESGVAARDLHRFPRAGAVATVSPATTGPAAFLATSDPTGKDDEN